MCFHKWTKWTVKTRQMLLVGGLLVSKEERGKEFTEEYQERQCTKCSLTKRRLVW